MSVTVAMWLAATLAEGLRLLAGIEGEGRQGLGPIARCSLKAADLLKEMQQTMRVEN